MVVQMREGGGEVVAGHDQVGAVADADLVDVVEEVVGGVAGEDVGEPGLDAHAHQRQPAGRLPVRRPWRTARRRASRRSPRRGARGAGCDSDIAMSR